MLGFNQPFNRKIYFKDKMKYAGMFSDSIRDNNRRWDKYDRKPLGDTTNQSYGRTHNSMLINKPKGAGGIYNNQERHIALEDYEKKVAGYPRPNPPATTTHAGYQAYQSPYLRGSQGSSPHIAAGEAVFSKHSTPYRNPDPYPKDYPKQSLKEHPREYPKEYNRSYESKYKYHYQPPAPAKVYDNYLQKPSYEPRAAMNIPRTTTPTLGKQPSTSPYFRQAQQPYLNDRYERPKPSKYTEETTPTVSAIRSRSYVRQPARDTEIGYDAGSGKELLRNLDKVQDKIRSLLKQ